MDTPFPISPLQERRKGRSYLWAGIILCLLGLVLCAIQFGLKILQDPWYMPILTTGGVLLVLGSLLRRFTLARMVVLTLLALLAVFEWYFLMVFARVPEYDGPAQVGKVVPAFQTLRADGLSFSDKNMQDGQTTALVFFRGRW